MLQWTTENKVFGVTPEGPLLTDGVYIIGGVAKWDERAERAERAAASPPHSSPPHSSITLRSLFCQIASHDREDCVDRED